MRAVAVVFSVVSLLVGLAAGYNVPRDDASIQGCHSEDRCIYPPHSVPSCGGLHCSFTCKDGYQAWPAYGIPILCKCEWPNKICPNGKCAKSCPSGYPYKRDLERQCRAGLTACGIPGRGPKSWECLDTQTDLESCGGCVIGLGLAGSDGVDCTAIDNVSDVSCIRGKCVVHKCRKGYEIGKSGDFCEGPKENSILRAAQYGLEHLRAGAL